MENKIVLTNMGEPRVFVGKEQHNRYSSKDADILIISETGTGAAFEIYGLKDNEGTAEYLKKRFNMDSAIDLFDKAYDSCMTPSFLEEVESLRQHILSASVGGK